MNGIIVGKRVPIGAAVNGCVLFGGEIWNLTHPDLELSMAVIGGLAITLTMLAQILVVNCLGVTHVQSDKK